MRQPTQANGIEPTQILHWLTVVSDVYLTFPLLWRHGSPICASPM